MTQRVIITHNALRLRTHRIVTRYDELSHEIGVARTRHDDLTKASCIGRIDGARRSNERLARGALPTDSPRESNYRTAKTYGSMQSDDVSARGHVDNT